MLPRLIVILIVFLFACVGSGPQVSLEPNQGTPAGTPGATPPSPSPNPPAPNPSGGLGFSDPVGQLSESSRHRIFSNYSKIQGGVSRGRVYQVQSIDLWRGRSKLGGVSE